VTTKNFNVKNGLTVGNITLDSATGTSTSTNANITNSLTANTISSSRLNIRTSTTASTATLTPDISAFDQYNITAQAAPLTIAAPIGSPVDGNKLMIRILDDGTAY